MLSSQAKGLCREDFALYNSLMNELRKDSYWALLHNVWTLLRRLILLYVAMFLASHAWFQVLIFTAMSIFSLVYLLETHPFKAKKENNLSFFNEWVTLGISYLFMVINGACYVEP